MTALPLIGRSLEAIVQASGLRSVPMLIAERCLHSAHPRHSTAGEEALLSTRCLTLAVKT